MRSQCSQWLPLVLKGTGLVAAWVLGQPREWLCHPGSHRLRGDSLISESCHQLLQPEAGGARRRKLELKGLAEIPQTQLRPG